MKKNTPFKYLLVAIAGLMGAIALQSNAQAWGPENRPTYTNESPAPYATFNSITDNVAVGDERNFVRVAEVGTDAPYVDELEVIPGKEYEVYIYYHNNAASNTNATGFGIATNTRIASAYPTILNPGERGMISGIISWSYVTPSNPDNAQTGEVWDEAYLTTKYENVVLRYKTGTATIHNAGKANGSVLPTALFTSEGTPIGFNILTGTIPGCAEYSGYITYTLVAEHTDSELTKQISLDGENWSDSFTTNPGEYVTYKVTFSNTGNTTLTNVIFKDTHSEGLSLRPGSTVVYDVNNTSGKTINDILDISGYNVGDVAPGALVQIIYQAKVSNDIDDCAKLKNTISVAYNGGDQKYAESFVNVSCAEPTPEPEPEPEPEPTPEPEPELPTEIVNTGPLEITMAIIVIAAIIGAGIYYWRTKRTLKTVKNKASGKKTDKDQQGQATASSKPDAATSSEQNTTPADKSDASKEHATDSDKHDSSSK